MTRMRWTSRILSGLMLVAPLAGCKQQLFLEPGDYTGALQEPLAKLDANPHEAIVPPPVAPGTAPSTVADPARPARPITLKEAVAIALEQGTTGFTVNANNQGIVSDNLPTFTGRGSTGTDTIRAFALDPASAAAEIERSVSKFDARWITSMTWQKVDQALPVAFQQSLNNGDVAQFSSTLGKPLPTGGVAGITFNVNYRNLSAPPDQQSQFAALPTSYTPQLLFTFEQPLLQGFGVEINQLLGQHPGSQLIPGLRPSGGQGSEGILVTRVRLDQQRAEFDRNVNNMLTNVEISYWNLFGAYYNLFAQEEGLKQSYDAFLILKNRAVGGVARPQIVNQYAAQVASFRAQVVTARGQVLNSERTLRGFLGMRSDDGTRLVPVDEPTLAAYKPDYYQLANEAMQFRPELLIARAELKAQQLNVILQKNQRRPDLRFLGNYDIQGVGPEFTGDDATTSALANFGRNQFNSYQFGLRLDMPLGFRDANALVRQAQIGMRKAYFFLTDAERKALEYLTAQYRQTLESYELIKQRRQQRQELEIYVSKNLQVLNTGAVGQAEFEGFIGNLLTAQQNLASATAQEFQAIAQYNSALAGLEYAKGTVQQYNNVTVSDGPLPQWVEKKAADHFAARDAAIQLREHPAEYGSPPPLAQYQPMADLPYSSSASQLPGTALPPPASLPTSPEPLPLEPKAKPAPAVPAAPNRTVEAEPAPSGTFTSVGTVSLPARPTIQLRPPADAPALPGAVSSESGFPATAFTPAPLPAFGVGSTSPALSSPTYR